MHRVEPFDDLLAKARAGDAEAIERLMALARPWIEQVARNCVAPHSPDRSISDLVQEAWLHAWQRLDQFQGAVSEGESLAMFRSWLARIVERLGANAVRDAGAQKRTPPGKVIQINNHPDDSSRPGFDPCSSEPTPSANVQAAERTRLVQGAVDSLTDPLDQAIIRLRFAEGLSLRQVAHRLDCNHETVRQRYHAVLAQLQTRLAALA